MFLINLFFTVYSQIKMFVQLTKFALYPSGEVTIGWRFHESMEFHSISLWPVKSQ